jgi:transposase InsO family protein
LDDILIAGTDYEDHLNTLAQVLERLLKFGFKLNKSKCKFLQSSVVYLGHLIGSAVLHPTEDKLVAVRDAPPPKDATALKSFLGLTMFYSRFMPHHSTVLAPLNNLLNKNVPWKWTKSEDAAFTAAKNLLLNSRTLVHYNESLPLVLSCDASSYGAGAVLSHVINGKHKPIAFASRTLTEAQRNYSQLEKEAFSIIFGLKRFHQFLCGNSFTILNDHRPLLTLLGPHCSVPAHTASRLQRWALILVSYHYKIEFQSTTAHADADSMSRLPLPQTWCPKSKNVECYFFEAGVVTNVTAVMIKKKAQVDPVLSIVYRYIQSGWPCVVDADMIPYKNRSDQLTIHQGCIIWGDRVVVPPSLGSAMLTELHDTHPGMKRMKRLARSYVCWPKIDPDIEQTVSTCPVCQKMRSEQAKAPVHPWTFSSQPWSRIHIDFAGPIAGKMYLVVVDAYIKFPEVVKMTTTTGMTTINALRDIFSRHGLPEILVSNNGPQFIAGEFQQFCRNNGIMPRTSAAYKPSTNDQAERVVQILKPAIEQARITKQGLNVVIAKGLLVYRNAPHSTMGAAPSVLFMGRRLRTRIDLVFPSVQEHVKQKQYKVLERSANLNVRSLLKVKMS